MSEDTISRQAAIDIERNATVDTNPSHFEAHQKFTQYMDDAEISSFGRWQWSNGFNTAHTAVGIDLKKLPSAQPEQEWIPCSERLPEVGKDVMVCYDFKGHRSVLIGVLYGDEKFHGYDDEYLTPEGRKYRKAVAWMPLPKPYNAETK